jgi:hypothetical protein
LYGVEIDEAPQKNEAPQTTLSVELHFPSRKLLSKPSRDMMTTGDAATREASFENLR